MEAYRYTLQPYGQGKNTRFTCPNCFKQQQFTRYINSETGDYIHELVGICNRAIACGYHYSPADYFKDNPDQKPTWKVNWTARNAMVLNSNDIAPSYIPLELFKQSRQLFERNNFIQFLLSNFGKAITEKLVAQYNIGTSKKWPGATIFWQIDTLGRIRTGKVMLYNPVTGKRIKEPYNHISWVHKALSKDSFNLSQCMFGEQLLSQFPNKPVGIVESEKTAIICSAFLPEFNWLAIGGLSFLTENRCAILRSRNVTLFPDLGGYDKWLAKSKELNHITAFKVSDLLERNATSKQIQAGLDLADFLLKS